MVRTLKTINIDSRMREHSNDLSTNFTFKLSKKITNIYKIRIASIELPNMWYNVTSVYNNTDTTIRVLLYNDNTVPIEHIVVIPDGIYTPDDVIYELDKKFKIIDCTFKVLLDVRTLKIHITCDKRFTIFFQSTTFILKYYHIGHMLGFINTSYESILNESNVYTIVSDSLIDFVGPPYVLLSLHNIGYIDHYISDVSDNLIRCMAKIIIREEKGAMIYDDGSTLIGNCINSKLPIILEKLDISLLNSYGEIIYLNGLDFSFTLELEYES